jgi:hypothetical protein
MFCHKNKIFQGLSLNLIQQFFFQFLGAKVNKIRFKAKSEKKGLNLFFSGGIILSPASDALSPPKWTALY